MKKKIKLNVIVNFFIFISILMIVFSSYKLDILMILFAFTINFIFKKENLQKKLNLQIVFLITLFLLFLQISLIKNQYENFSLSYLVSLIYFFLFLILLNSYGRINIVLKSLFILSLINSTVQIIQGFMIFDLNELPLINIEYKGGISIEISDWLYKRNFGLYNTAGNYTILYLFSSIYLWMIYLSKNNNVIVFILLFLYLFSAVLLSFSRNAIIVFIMINGFFLFQKNKKLFFLMISIILFLGFNYLYDLLQAIMETRNNLFELNNRLLMYDFALSCIDQNLFFGIGSAVDTNPVGPVEIHNTPLLILTNFGIFAFFIFLFFILTPLLINLKSLNFLKIGYMGFLFSIQFFPAIAEREFWLIMSLMYASISIIYKKGRYG